MNYGRLSTPVPFFPLGSLSVVPKSQDQALFTNRLYSDTNTQQINTVTPTATTNTVFSSDPILDQGVDTLKSLTVGQGVRVSGAGTAVDVTSWFIPKVTVGRAAAFFGGYAGKGFQEIPQDIRQGQGVGSSMMGFVKNANLILQSPLNSLSRNTTNTSYNFMRHTTFF